MTGDWRRDSRKIFDYISDTRTWIAVYTSHASLNAIKENKTHKFRTATSRTVIWLTNFVYLCIYYHASHPGSIFSGASVIPASQVRRSAMLLLLTVEK